jgi:hypothetical protein
MCYEKTHVYGMEYVRVFRSLQHLFKTLFRSDKYFARPLSLEVLEITGQLRLVEFNPRFYLYAMECNGQGQLSIIKMFQNC